MASSSSIIFMLFLFCKKGLCEKSCMCLKHSAGVILFSKMVWCIKYNIPPTDKETDESWDIFIIWKINSGLVWAARPVLWKKKFGPIMSKFWGPFLYVFIGKRYTYYFWKYCSVRTEKEKLHKIKVKKVKKNWKYFLRGKTQFCLGIKISM